MSSLLPLILLSIALLHCAQADDPKCQIGAQAYSSDGIAKGSPTVPIHEGDCDDGKCAIVLERTNSGKYIVNYKCEPNPMDFFGRVISTGLRTDDEYDPHGCKSEQKLTCVCDPQTGSICNLPENFFNPKGDEHHKSRVKLARQMGFIALPDAGGKIFFKLSLLKCEKWTVTFDYKGDVTDGNLMKRNEACHNMCYTKATHNEDAKTFNIESNCYSQERPSQVVPYEHNGVEPNALTVYCLATSDSPCNTLDLMFDPDNSDHLERIGILKAKTGLITQSSTVDGKKLVDFKWSNCMEFHYEQTAEGVQTVHNKKTIHCGFGVCSMKVTRMDENKKISVDTGCAADNGLPKPTETKCRTVLEEQTTTCRCLAEKEPCNTISALYNPTSSMKGQKKRLHNLQYIGINVTFDSAGEDKFKYEEDFGKTTTEATITVSGVTTVPLLSTARPPSQLPEDDPYYEELLGSATGLSLTFTVLFSILRLI